jgi:precorrin-6B methylase 2
MEIDFSAEDGEPRYSFESCGADTDADGVVTFEVCGAPMIVRQGGELGERLWASGMDLAREIERGVALRHVPEHLIASRPFGSPVRREENDDTSTGGDPHQANDSSGLRLEDAGEDPLRHARVLELGAGCAGLPGLAMALRHGCTVTLTEHPDVVPLLRANVAQFQARITAMAGVNEISETIAAAAARVSVEALDWTDRDALKRVAEGDGYDIVVWADAGYLGDDNDALLTAAVACVAPGGKILACESLRSQAKTTTFRRIFGALGFFCVKVLGDGVKGNVDAWVYAMTWQCEAEACLARKRIAEGSFEVKCEREVQPAVTWKPRTTMTRSASDSSPRKWQSSKLRA